MTFLTLLIRLALTSFCLLQLLSLAYPIRKNSPTKISNIKCKIEPNSDYYPRPIRLMRSIAASVMVATSLVGPVHSDSQGKNSPLEMAIQRLETSNGRSETIQSLADVFEAAGTKTLLARTRYKYRIITAINDKHVALQNDWDQALSYASGELKRRVDPYRTVDLGPYLKVAPFVGGVGYLGALFIQQAIPELFTFAYPFAVFILVAPALFIMFST